MFGLKAKFVYYNKESEILEVKTKVRDGILVAYIPKDEVGSDVNYIDFLYDEFRARVGDEGYFICSAGNGTYLTRFIPREDKVVARKAAFVGCYGWNKGKDGEFAIVTGMRLDFGTISGVKDGEYYVFPRFYIDGDPMYEDIEVELYHLENGTYSEMAKIYRNYQLTRKGCKALKERTQKDPRLAKAIDGIEVRMRQAWKPVPSPIEHQTPENEPPLHVACDFDRVGDVLDEFKNQGISKAEFCLVGWNIGGHDGRFPQIFPVEPRLGGEEKMVTLIKKAKEMGYNMVCHDDAVCAYSIADCFDEEFLLKNKDGSLEKRPYCWGGGRPYKICPQRQYEKFETSHQRDLSALGFEGIHYIDVITIFPVMKCYDEKHPTNRLVGAAYLKKAMELAKKSFGGFSSESSYDFAAESTDYVLYAAMANEAGEATPLCDELIPFWHIVYHGIISYNASTFTLNYMAKSAENRLRYFEYGGRPLVCYFANFAKNNNWMGTEDFYTTTDEQLKDSVSKIRQMAEDYEALKPERFEFIDNHEKVAEGVYVTTYSNGTRITVDYNNKTYKIERKN